jgi:1-acyl-sn-glycerol-3-phosphate acyltransferase
MSDHLLQAAALPTWGQRTALRLLQLLGWRLHYRPLPGPHGIAVVYPHTSNWDFVIGILGKWALGLPFRWLAKDSLFKGPMGAVMRYWGGVAIDRSAPCGATRQLAAQMLAQRWCWIAITPEGTRSYRPYWKSGFYHLARAAGVPVLLVALDYGKKQLRVTDTIALTGDEDADMRAIASAYRDCRGLYPRKSAPARLAPREQAN